jgi:3D (Asp-Asp-Asp) domain-containing protein
MSENYFMGLDGFVWFTGVVEDRNDPDALGRVRVRCLGFHTEDLNDIPTADLPWATVMHPTTDPSMQGLGNSPSFLVEGSWVVGFFSDAREKQQPIVIGSLPGIPEDAPDYTKGFNDPRSPYTDQLDYAGTPSYGPYPVDGDDYQMPSGHDLGESDTSRLAQGQLSEEHQKLIDRRNNRQTEIPIATQPNLSTVSDEAVQETRTTFDEPHPKNVDYESIEEEGGDYVSALYPYNHVFESEAGHITEIDDTPNAERTFRQHTSGTYEEVIADGTKTVKVIGDNYEVIMGGSNVYVSGAVNLTVGGDVRHLVKGNYHLEVEGNYTQKIHKNMRTKVGAGEVGGNLEEEIKGTHSFNISESVKGRIGKDVNVTTEGDETRINNGKFDLVAKSDISAITTGGKMLLNASGNVSIDAVSGIMALKSGTTLNLKSATLMTITSETTIDMNATTEVDIDSALINLN